MIEGDRRFRHPGVFVVGCFALLILVGGLLLALPVSHQSTDSTPGVSDAFFTAASAVTVTGLVVADTGTAWSVFGEIVILALIQIGGLGIMTLAGFMGLAINRRLRTRIGMLAGEEIGLNDLGVLGNLIRDLVRFVFASELVVAVLLTGRFLLEGDHSVLHSLHLGIFHSVSAFNNAGFSVLDGGVERYVGDWYVSLVLAGAFILGGIGFPVVFEVRRRWRTPRRWSIHTKVSLSVSAVLLAFGTVVIGLVEWTNEATFGSLSTPDRVLASFFQSATARTAGFNTVPIGSMRAGSWLVLILLMVIGASSASTGGGIKTTTWAVVVRSTISEFRGDANTTLFDRAIPRVLERQALALVVAALGAVGTATFLLSAFHSDIALGEILFESASAFGTVGISTGITEELSLVGRLIIMALMFIGRVGPITFGTAVLLRPALRQYGFAEEPLIVG